MTWDRDKLLMELNEFQFGCESSSPELLKYLEFYGLSGLANESVSHCVGWMDAGAFRVVLQTYLCAEAKGTVFVFHGYFDHAGLYHHLTRHLISKGFSVVIYDMPGHGLSSGKPTAITSFDEYQAVLEGVVSHVNDKVANPLYAIGQSTGAAVLIHRASAEPENKVLFERIVLLAPLVRPEGWKGIKFVHSLIAPFAEVWRRSFSVNSTDRGFLDFLRGKDPLQSKIMSVSWVGALKSWVNSIEARDTSPRALSVIQGTSDKTVDWAHNIPIIRRLFQNVKVTYIDQGHHHLVNESSEIRQQVFAAVDAEFGVA
jgi:alpha-beta hydrolase superfamily lysophospholipase